MNGKFSNATLTLAVVVALGLGVVVGRFVLAPPRPPTIVPSVIPPAVTKGTVKHGVIQLQKDKKNCKHIVDSAANSYPVLLPASSTYTGDQIAWVGLDQNGNSVDLEVIFPQINPNDPNQGPGSPFTDGNGNMVRTFKTPANSTPTATSTPIVTKVGDFPFEAVKVGDKSCKHAGDPGVHVN